MASTQDLTVGNPPEQLIRFSVPLLLGNLFQQFYNVIDTMIIGRNCGDLGLASIGAATPLNYLLNNLTIGVTLGFSVVIAKYFGARNYTEQKRSEALSIFWGLLIAVGMSIIAGFCAGPFFRFTKTPEDVLPGAYNYISVIIMFQVIPFIYNLEAAFLRAVGNSRIPVLALIIGLISNTLLDILLVSGMGLDLKGAALATVISQLISALICLIYIWKKCDALHLHRNNFELSKSATLELLGMGFSTAMTLSVVEVGTIVLQSAINSFGSMYISAHTASRRLLSLATVPLNSMGSAAATFTGQNYGAKKPERIIAGIKSAMTFSFAWSLIANLVFWPFGGALIGFLTGTQNQEIIQTSVYYLRFHFPLLFVLSVLFIFRQALQGLTDKRTPVISSALEMICKVVITYIMIPIIGFLGVCIAEPLIWVICMIFLVAKFLANPFIREYRAVQKP